MLILEYAPYGDLLGYLRKSRGMEDKYYNCPENWQQEVTSYDLLSFAQQIASGMSFLASKKVHIPVNSSLIIFFVYSFFSARKSIGKINNITPVHISLNLFSIGTLFC